MTERGGPRAGHPSRTEDGSRGSSGRQSPPDPGVGADHDGRSPGLDTDLPGDHPSRSRQPLRASWDPIGDSARRPRGPRPDRSARKQSRLGRFVATYGWRAYAIPVLTVVTILVLVDAIRGGSPESGPTGEPGFGARSTSIDGTGVIGVPPLADGRFAATIPSGALPDGGPYTAVGDKTWRIVPGSGPKVGEGTEQVFTYTVEVENGVDTSGFGGDESFARMVDQTLANPKSWTQDPRVAFQRTDTGDPTFRISLTSQMTVREACGYDIQLEVSCYNPGIDRVVLNEPRWVRGAVAFQGDIGSYRQYQINHEVGHAIGYQQHQPCETDGGLAPVMMQQTFGTANNDIAKLDPEGVVPMDGKVCRFNPWPHPRG